MECSFGITHKFQVLSSVALTFKIQTVTDISKAVCILHKLVRVKDGLQYSSPVIERDRGIQEFGLHEEVMQVN